MDAERLIEAARASDGSPVRVARASRVAATAVRSAWSRWCRYDFTGVLAAVVFFCLSLTPSLLPRSWLLQGVIGGIASTIGYGVGVLVSYVTRLIVRRRPAPAVQRTAWRALALAGPAAVAVFLYAGSEWQRDIRRLVGSAPLPRYHSIAILTLSWLLLAAVVTASRALLRTSRWTARKLSRFIPPPVAAVLGVVCVALISAVILRAVVYGGFITAANAAFGHINAETRPLGEPPASASVASNRPSLIPWRSLGRMGRHFVSAAPTVRQLDAFSGRRAKQPIRVYAGLASAPSLDAEAALAVKELHRTGAFHRRTLLVVTSTGTGWVDPNAVAALEYMYDGDTAAVSIQYSYLPSWISFLADRRRAEQAGRALFERVYTRWRQLPPDGRPKLLVFGESLGALGAQAAFTNPDDIMRRTDGALWEGPPNSSRLWQVMETRRQPGTPEVRPLYLRGETVRFGGTPTDLAEPGNRWRRPRVVYLQHASDPVVWWSPDLILHEPDWLQERRGADVSPSMRWYPFVTFLQVSADLAWATGVPNGHGHNYHTEPAGAWSWIAPPPGWTAAETERLERVLASLPRL